MGAGENTRALVVEVFSVPDAEGCCCLVSQAAKDSQTRLDGLEVSVLQAEQRLEKRMAKLETGLNARLDELVAHLRLHGEGAQPGAVNV